MESNTLKILLSSNSRDEAERINKLFRNAGHSAQTHRVTSIQDLSESLNDQRWDLALCEQNYSDVDVDDALKQLQERSAETPVILLSQDLDQENIINGLRKGVQDVVQLSQDEHLLCAANREIENLHIRRSQAELERTLAEVNTRFKLLMAEADDAVAYILDGMHIDVNDAYAKIFGYDDNASELIAIPIIDLCSTDDHEKIKVFMRHYNEDSEQQLSFTGVAQDGCKFDGNMRFAPASFDGEDCTQVIIKRVEASAPTNLATVDTNTDPVTQLYNRYYFVDKLTEHLDNLSEDKSSMLYIGMNEPTALKKHIGLSGSHAVRHGIAEIIKDYFLNHQDITIAHYGEDSFTVLLKGIGSSQAQEISDELCSRIEDQIFDVDKMSAQCTCSVGIIDFTKARFSSAYQVMDAAFSVLEEARTRFSIDQSKASVVIFHPQEDGDIEIGFHLGDLIEENRLRMVYQPIIHLHGERLERYDATLRLLDCEGKEQAIDQLIQSVNQKVGDTSLDRWLVTEAFDALKNLRATAQDAQITINLTQNSLLDKEFPNWIQQHCLNIRLDPALITFQLQETIVAHHLSQAISFFEAISRLRGKCSISHFGNTQDSFKMLKRLKVDYVMTDGSFTLALQKDPANAEKLKRVLLQLKEHKAATIVPFVENAATLACLWQMNVHYIQGHYLQAPAEIMDYEFADMV